MEVEGGLDNEPTHMSYVEATVTDILSNRLGILTTVSSKERVLFDIENLYVAGERCDSSHPLSSYVTVGKTELQCNASLLQENNDWNAQYEATCVWKHEKPSFIKIFDHYMSSCSCGVSMVPGYVYKGHIAKVSPPDVALAVSTVRKISVPVLIFLNNLYEDCDLRELKKPEWIQDHLRAGDVVEFEFEKKQRRSIRRRYNVATFAWKTEQNMRQHVEHQQEFQSNTSSYSKMERHSSGDVPDKPASDVDASEVTSNTVSHVGTYVDSCTETNRTTSVTAETEILVECGTDKTKCASTCEASEQLMKCYSSPWKGQMSTSKDAYFTGASLDKSQECNIRAVQEYMKHDTAHTVTHELTPHSPGKLEHHITGISERDGVGPPDVSEQDVGVGPPDISEREQKLYISELDGGISLPDVVQENEVGMTDISEQNGGVAPPETSKADIGVGSPYVLLSEQVGGANSPNISEQEETNAPLDLPEEKYGAVSMYRIPQSEQGESEKIHHLPVIGIVLNVSKIQMINPQFSYELFRCLSSPEERDSEFRAMLIGFVTFPYELTHQPKSSSSSHGKNSFTVDECSEAGLRMPAEALHTQDSKCEPSSMLEIALEMPRDPVKQNNIVAVPRSLSARQSGVAVQVSGITLHKHKPCSVLPSSGLWIQIPGTLDELPYHNPVSDYKDLILQGKVHMNRSAAFMHHTKCVCSEQLCCLHSVGIRPCVLDTVPQELGSAFENELNGHATEPMDSHELNSNKSVWDIPQILVPVFVPQSLQSSAEEMSAYFATKWTLISGVVTSKKHCLMYVPGSVLSSRKPSYGPGIHATSKSCQEPPDRPSELSVRYSGFSLLSKQQQHTCKPHCGAYSGYISSLGYNHGTVAFTVDGREESALFYSQKVYRNGIKIRKKTKLHDTLYIEMPVTLDVVQYEGEVCKYKATAIYIETDLEDHLEGSQVADALPTSLCEEVLNNDRQVIYLNCWDSFSVDHLSVGEHSYGCICRTCTSADTEGREDLAVTALTFPRQEASASKNVDTGVQETIGSAQLSEEEPKSVLPSDKYVSTSEEKMAVPLDGSQEVKVPESCSGFEAQVTISSSEVDDCFVTRTQETAELNSNVQIVSTKETDASRCIIPLDCLPKSSKNIPGAIDGLWSSTVVLMTATVHKLKVRVLIHGRNLFVDKKHIVMDTGWQHRAQGMKVFADVSVVWRDHPSGAMYVATCAWQGKRPRDVEQGKKAESCAGTCHRNHADNDSNSVISSSEVDVQGKGNAHRRRNSGSSEPMSIKCPTENKSMKKEKCMHFDKPDSVQRSIETNEESVHETLQSKEFVGTLKSGTKALKFGTGSGTDKFKDIDITDLLDEVRPASQDEVTGNAHLSASSGKGKVMQLPVLPTQRTQLTRQIKGELARVKRYESSTRGVLEYAVSGVELEVMFHKSVVNFCGNNETTDLEEYLPVGSEVCFEGEMVGEDKLLGCSDIIVTSIQATKMERKRVNSKATHFRTIGFDFIHEGLFQGRVYEGVISQICPPFAFVAAVIEGGKTYDVFVLNQFFSPVEYGRRLPAKHPVVPYIAKGDTVHVMVSRAKEVNSKHTHEWYAVDAWTEEPDIASAGSKPQVGFTHRQLDTEHFDEYLEGIIMTLYQERGLLQVDHLREEVTFFRKDTFLFGVQLATLDLQQVLLVGKSHTLMPT
jgi:hypothetical protein